MQPNPYTPGPGQVPRTVAGREREQTRLRDLLGRVSAFGEFAGPLVSLLGPRGFGKTVLLKGVQHEAAAAGFVPVWVPLSHGTSLLSELTDQLEVALRNSDSVDSAALDRFRSSSRTFGAEISANLGVVSGKLSRSRTERAARPALPRAPISALTELLGTSADLVTKPGGAGLVILVDEVHAADQVDLGILLNALQALEGTDHRLAVLAAGLPTTPGLLSRAATFAERTTWLELHRLPAEAAAHAFTGPAALLDVSWRPDAIALLVHASGGLPHLVQLLGSSVWEATRPEEGHVFTRAEVLEGCTEALRQVLIMFGARWDAATPAERDFLVAMSSYPEPVARGDIARTLGRPTQALGVVRNRLVDKNVIEPAEHGKLRFTMRGFGAFIRAQGDETMSWTRPGPARDLTEDLLADLLEGAEDLPELQ